MLKAFVCFLYCTAKQQVLFSMFFSPLYLSWNGKAAAVRRDPSMAFKWKQSSSRRGGQDVATARWCF